jgi:predicted secreted protein
MSPNVDEHRRGLRSAVRRVLAGGVLATIAWCAIGGFVSAPVVAAPTAPAPTTPAPASTNATCAITGYSAPDDVALDKLVAQLGKQTAFQIAGTPLAPGGVWTVPAGQAAVLVIDHEQPSTTYRERLTVAGVQTWSSAGAATGHRWITGKLPSAQS